RRAVHELEELSVARGARDARGAHRRTRPRHAASGHIVEPGGGQGFLPEGESVSGRERSRAARWTAPAKHLDVPVDSLGRYSPPIRLRYDVRVPTGGGPSLG